MKNVCRLVFLGAVAAASCSVALADSITISGGDTFNSSAISFVSGQGVVSSTQDGGSQQGGIFSSFMYKVATLSDFAFSSGSGTQLFSVNNGAGSTLTFTINGPWTTNAPGSNANGATLDLAGTGTFTESGLVNMSEQGTFSLTSSSAGSNGSDFSYQLIGSPAAVTPEPNSLVLLGSGLMASAFAMFTRRRAANY